ncbi:MAG: M13 family metallopeptidase [Polyangiales bacterium]
MPTHRKSLCFALACGLVASTLACARPAPAAPAQAPSPAAEVPAPRASAPASGLDLTGLDRSVAPGDDFDAYANGAWREATPIPDDLPGTGVWLTLVQRAEKRTADLIQGLSGTAEGSDARRIADYYAAYMDEAGIEARGIAPLADELGKIGALKSKGELARHLGADLRADVDPINATNLHTERLFGLFVAQGLDDPSHHVAYLLQGGLGLPDRDYYLAKDARMEALRGPYKAYVAGLLKLAGVPQPEQKATKIVQLETKIAAFHATIVESEEVHDANNPWPTAQFTKNAPGLDWPAFFEAAGLSKQAKIIAWQPGALRGIASLVQHEPLETWKSWLTFHAIHRSATVLPKAFADLSFDFYGRKLQGTPAQRARWKRAVASTNFALTDAVGKLYVEQHFPPAAKAQITKLVDDIIAAFRARVDTLAWMSPATKEKAKAKAATLRVGVGYPEHFRAYEGLDVRADDPVGNRLRAELHEYRHQLAKLDAPVDKGEWWIAPQTVNALNLPLQNAMNFPAAILEPPFFDPSADPAANYGAIGAIIGHEISHSFDSIGAGFDAEGRLVNWWTPEDAAHFKAASARLVAQYDAYEPLPGAHVSGKQTLAENIADVSGLTIAHAAYVASLQGAEAPVIDGFTGAQRFFLAFGQAWRQKLREPALRARLATDVHAPAALRAQTVRNLDAWYEAFPSQPGQKLHLAESERVRIW